MLRIGMMTENLQLFTSIDNCLEIIKSVGYECADLTLFETRNTCNINPIFSSSDYLEKAKEIKKLSDKLSLPLVQAHAPFAVYKFGDDEYNKTMFTYLVRCIEICGVIGIKNLVVHPFNYITDEENIEFYNKLLPYAEKSNVIMCCENMFGWNKEMDRAGVCACSLNDSFIKTVKGVNSPYLKACVDIGHAEMFSYLGQTARKMIEGLNEEVVCLHIHDNNKRYDLHKIPFTDSIDFDDVIKGLKNIDYKNDLIIETSITREIDSLDKMIQFCKNQLEAGKKFKNKLIK